jgi:DNA-directed RNA polymerase, mitochondrial
VTRLPVLLDGSCNGIQHLALMTRDKESGRLVNLTDADEIFDLYDTVTNGVNMKLMAADDENAAWWVERGVTRDLLKQPIMTFSYGVTPAGARNQIIDACKNHNACPSWEQAQYLAKTVLDVSKVLLPRPALAMGFVRDLTKRQAERGLSLEWISPTGVPVVNRYHKSKVKPVEMQLRGTTVTYRVADGYEPRILKRDAADAAPANLVHSMDAAHLIRSVNAAAEEGIEDFVTVHDSYGTIAPRVTRFQQVVRRELALMYLGYDALARLWARNGAPDDLTIPEAGGLDPFEVQNSEYSFK